MQLWAVRPAGSSGGGATATHAHRRSHHLNPNLDWVLYLAVMVDAWSPGWLGWSMAGQLPIDLVLDALEMAIARRRPTIAAVSRSDRDSQYTSLAIAAVRPASLAPWARRARGSNMS